MYVNKGIYVLNYTGHYFINSNTMKITSSQYTVKYLFSLVIITYIIIIINK